MSKTPTQHPKPHSTIAKPSSPTRHCHTATPMNTQRALWLTVMFVFLVCFLQSTTALSQITNFVVICLSSLTCPHISSPPKGYIPCNRIGYPLWNHCSPRKQLHSSTSPGCRSCLKCSKLEQILHPCMPPTCRQLNRPYHSMSDITCT